MKTLKIGGKEIKLYDDIMHIPKTRFDLFQKNLMTESGIGGTVNEFDEKISNAINFLNGDKIDMAIQELQNMRQGIFMLENNESAIDYTLACLVYSIDGKEVSDMNDSTIQEVVTILKDEGISFKEIFDAKEEVKKKS